MAPIQQFRILAPSTPLTNPITLSVSAEPSFRRSGPKRAVRSTAGLQSGNPRLGWLNDLHSNGGRQDGRFPHRRGLTFLAPSLHANDGGVTTQREPSSRAFRTPMAR